MASGLFVSLGGVAAAFGAVAWFALPTTAEGSDLAGGGIVTLYALDPIAARLNLRDGDHGGVFDAHMAKNRGSDLDFAQYRAGEFTVGIEGSRTGVIVDLGTAIDLRQRYGYEETVGNGQGFASLRVVGREVVILRDYARQTTQTVAESEQLFGAAVPGAHAPVKLGHVYLVRIADARDPRHETLAKLLVLEYRPGESVTLRWQLL